MTDQKQLPRHLAIIMDGNNRWAKKRLMGGIAGHKAGVNAVRAVVEGCAGGARGTVAASTRRAANPARTFIEALAAGA